MKKYKLIKEYPGSPKLGSIAYTSKNTLADEHDNYIIGEDSPFQCSWILKKYVDNNPEYWEEIIEKDYEILSFYQDFRDTNIPGETYIWLTDQVKGDRYWSRLGYVTSPMTTEEILEKKGYKIHSVKRLTDGEVFTIGDICYPINTNYNKHPIIKFWFDNSGQLRVDSENYSMSIYTIIKAKKPLFITEDGVDIFEGDVFSIVYSDLSVNYMATDISLIKLGCKVFSTIEKANDYIIENKACLSLNEIENILGKYFYVDVIYHKLYKLIEEKLNIK